MQNFSLIEKFNILMGILVSSPLFLFAIMFSVALLIFYIICKNKNIQINKYVFIVIWAIVALILLIRYFNEVIILIDKLFDVLFMAIYFPNYIVYSSIILISNICLILSIVKKENKKLNTLSCLIFTVVLDIFCIMILNIISVKSINFYDPINMYTNTELLVLLELSSSIFITWILVQLFISLYKKLKKYDKKDQPEIVFEEV